MIPYWRGLKAGKIDASSISVKLIRADVIGVCPNHMPGTFVNVKIKKSVHLKPFYVIEQRCCGICGMILSARLLVSGKRSKNK